MPTTVTITGTDPGSYIAPVLAPAAGTVETSAQAQILAQGICNQTTHLNNVVTSGAYTITCLGVVVASVVATATGAGDAGTFTGAGTGSGVVCVGGASGSGVAGLFTGGGTTGTGIICQGGSTNGTAVIGTGTGASGRGGSFSANAASLAIVCGAGNMAFTGAQPLKNADPGFNNYVCGTNQVKSWSLVDLNSGTITLTDGYNTSSITFNGSYIRVTFARAINNPVVHATLSSIAVSSFIVVSPTVVQIGMFTVSAGSFAQVNLSSTTATLGVTVVGRQ